MFPGIQNEIKKEMERRKMGKDVLDLKKQQEEEKTKRLLKERNREKAEEKAARDRVRQQIALVSSSFFLFSSLPADDITVCRITLRNENQLSRFNMAAYKK